MVAGAIAASGHRPGGFFPADVAGVQLPAANQADMEWFPGLQVETNRVRGAPDPGIIVPSSA